MTGNNNVERFIEIFSRREKRYSLFEKINAISLIISYILIQLLLNNGEAEGWAILLLLVVYLVITYLSFPKCPRCDTRLIFRNKELISYCNNCGIKLKK